MTWGKVDPDKLPDTVTCYVDSTIALPLLTAYCADATREAAAEAPVRQVPGVDPPPRNRVRSNQGETGGVAKHTGNWTMSRLALFVVALAFTLPIAAAQPPEAPPPKAATTAPRQALVH